MGTANQAAKKVGKKSATLVPIFAIEIKFERSVEEAQVHKVAATIKHWPGVTDVVVRSTGKPKPTLSETPPLTGWRLTPDELQGVRERVARHLGRPLKVLEEMLVGLLSDTELIDQDHVAGLAEGWGFSPDQLRGAREAIGIKTQHEKVFQGPWLWSPPDWWGVPPSD
jgi:hypothetical protein